MSNEQGGGDQQLKDNFVSLYIPEMELEASVCIDDYQVEADLVRNEVQQKIKMNIGSEDDDDEEEEEKERVLRAEIRRKSESLYGPDPYSDLDVGKFEKTRMKSSSVGRARDEEKKDLEQVKTQRLNSKSKLDVVEKQRSQSSKDLKTRKSQDLDENDQKVKIREDQLKTQRSKSRKDLEESSEKLVRSPSKKEIEVTRDDRPKAQRSQSRKALETDSEDETKVKAQKSVSKKDLSAGNDDARIQVHPPVHNYDIHNEADRIRHDGMKYQPPQKKEESDGSEIEEEIEAPKSHEKKDRPHSPSNPEIPPPYLLRLVLPIIRARTEKIPAFDFMEQKEIPFTIEQLQPFKLLFPYVFSGLKFLVTSFILFLLSDQVALQSGSTSLIVKKVFLIVPLPLFAIFLALSVEHACRTFIYYRLWEQYVVMSFKNRSHYHKIFTKSSGVGVLIFGVLGVWLVLSLQIPTPDKWKEYAVLYYAFYLLFLQVLSSFKDLFSIEDRLVNLHELYEKRETFAEFVITKIFRMKMSELYKKTTVDLSKIKFVLERNVKYDSLVLLALLREVKKERIYAQLSYGDQYSDARPISEIDDDLRDIRMFGLLIGRLGFEKKHWEKYIKPGISDRIEAFFYGINLLQEYRADTDSTLHKFGTFKNERNPVENLMWYMMLWVFIGVICIGTLEAWAFAGGINI